LQKENSTLNEDNERLKQLVDSLKDQVLEKDKEMEEVKQSDAASREEVDRLRVETEQLKEQMKHQLKELME
jgi:regulator of replication initiation timing